MEVPDVVLPEDRQGAGGLDVRVGEGLDAIIVATTTGDTGSGGA
jgi:hypothetical protein